MAVLLARQEQKMKAMLCFWERHLKAVEHVLKGPGEGGERGSPAPDRIAPITRSSRGS